MHLTPVDNEHQHRAVGALADRRTGVRTGIEDCGVLHLAVDYEHRLKGHAVHDALRLCVGIGHIAGVQDVIRVEADEAADSAVRVVVAYAVDDRQPLRRAAKTGAIRVIICAAVDAADRAVALAHGGQIVAVAAEGFRLADEHAAGVEHDHHIALEALLPDLLDDYPVAVVVNEAVAVRAVGLGGVGLVVAAGLGAALVGELDEGGVGRVGQGALLGLLYRVDLGFGEVDVCDEVEAPRLEHGVHEHIPERGGRPLDQHVFYRKPRDAEEDPRGEDEAKYPVNDALNLFPSGFLVPSLLFFFEELLLFVVICSTVLHIHTFAIDRLGIVKYS